MGLSSTFSLDKHTELVVYEMSDGFNSDIRRRIGDFELVMDRVQAAEKASPSSTLAEKLSTEELCRGAIFLECFFLISFFFSRLVISS